MKNSYLINQYKLILNEEFNFFDPSTWLEPLNKFIGQGLQASKSPSSTGTSSSIKPRSSDAAKALVAGDRDAYNQYLDSLSGMSKKDQQSAAIRARAMAFHSAKEKAANLKSKALDNDEIRELRDKLNAARSARDAETESGPPSPQTIQSVQDAAKALKAKEKELLDKSGYTQMARRRESFRSGSLNIVPQEKPDYSTPSKRYVNPNSAEQRLKDSDVLNQDGTINTDYGVKDEHGYFNTPAGRAAALRDAKEKTKRLRDQLEKEIAKEPPGTYPNSAARAQARGAEMTSISDDEFENKYGVKLPKSEPGSPFSERGGEYLPRASSRANSSTTRPFARRAGSGEFPPIPDRPTSETPREKKARMDKIKSDSFKRSIKVFPASPDRPSPETNEERKARISNDLRRARGLNYTSGVAPKESDY